MNIMPDVSIGKIIIYLPPFVMGISIVVFYIFINPATVIKTFTIDLGRLLVTLAISFIVSLCVFIFLRIIYTIIKMREDSGGTGSDIILHDAGVVQYDNNILKFMNGRAEQVLERQIEDSRDIDDAAVRTLRINIILLGALASFAQTGTSLIDVTQIHTIIGIILIIISSAFAIFTYHSSDPEYGPGPGYIDDFVMSRFNERYWRIETSLAYADWIDENFETNRDNGTLLLLCHIALVLGLALVLFGIYVTIISKGG